MIYEQFSVGISISLKIPLKIPSYFILKIIFTRFLIESSTKLLKNPHLFSWNSKQKWMLEFSSKKCIKFQPKSKICCNHYRIFERTQNLANTFFEKYELQWKKLKFCNCLLGFHGRHVVQQPRKVSIRTPSSYFDSCLRFCAGELRFYCNWSYTGSHKQLSFTSSRKSLGRHVAIRTNEKENKLIWSLYLRIQ